MIIITLTLRFTLVRYFQIKQQSIVTVRIQVVNNLQYVHMYCTCNYSAKQLCVQHSNERSYYAVVLCNQHH